MVSTIQLILCNLLCGCMPGRGKTDARGGVDAKAAANDQPATETRQAGPRNEGRKPA